MDEYKIPEQGIPEPFTKKLLKLLDVLLLEGPKTTGYGILTGLIVHGLVAGLAPGPFFARVPFYFYLAVGIMISNIVKWLVRRSQGPIPDSIKSQFAVIAEAKRNGLSETEAAALYQRAVKNYIEEAVNQKSVQSVKRKNKS